MPTLLNRTILPAVGGLVALGALACSRAPAPADPLILGSWVMDLEMPKSVDRLIGQHRPGSDPEQAWDAALDAANTRGEGPPRLTFRHGGHGTMEGSVLGHQVNDAFRWELAESTASGFTIATWTATRPDREHQAYAVETPDRIRMEGGLLHGTVLQRSK